MSTCPNPEILELCHSMWTTLIEIRSQMTIVLNVHDSIEYATLACFRAETDALRSQYLPGKLLRPTEAMAVCMILNEVFRETGDTDYLRSAIEVLEETVAANPGIDVIQTYGKRWITKWKSDLACTGVCDVGQSTKELGGHHCQAIQIPRFHWMDKVGRMIFAQLFRNGFAQTRDMDFLDSAIIVLHPLVPALAGNDPDKPIILGHLRTLFWQRFLASGSVSDLGKAIEATEEAVELHPRNESKAGIFWDLGQYRFA